MLLIGWVALPSALSWVGERTAGVAEIGSSALSDTADAVLPASRAEFRVSRGYGDLLGGAGADAELVLLPESTIRSVYRVDLSVDLAGAPVRWIVGDAETGDYLAFTLRSTRGGYELERRSTLDGQEPVVTSLDFEAAKLDDNVVSLVVRPGSVTTLLNGFGVDFVRDSTLFNPQVAFFAQKEDASIREVVVRGNEDDWGRFVAVARERIADWLS